MFICVTHITCVHRYGGTNLKLLYYTLVTKSYRTNKTPKNECRRYRLQCIARIITSKDASTTIYRPTGHATKFVPNLNLKQNKITSLLFVSKSIDFIDQNTHYYKSIIPFLVIKTFTNFFIYFQIMSALLNQLSSSGIFLTCYCCSFHHFSSKITS